MFLLYYAPPPSGSNTTGLSPREEPPLGNYSKGRACTGPPATWTYFCSVLPPSALSRGKQLGSPQAARQARVNSGGQEAEAGSQQAQEVASGRQCLAETGMTKGKHLGSGTPNLSSLLTGPATQGRSYHPHGRQLLIVCLHEMPTAPPPLPSPCSTCFQT